MPTSTEKAMMIELLHTNLVKNFDVNLFMCRKIVRECNTSDELRDILFNQDEWFCIHAQYSNPDFDFYFHEDPYIFTYDKDTAMQSKERFIWSIALEKEGHIDWDAALDI